LLFDFCLWVRFLFFELLFCLCGQFPEVCEVLLVVTLRVSANDGALVGSLLFILNDVFDVGVEFLLRADFVNVFDDLIGLDVELGHVEGQFFFLAEKAKL
jgi:hypothetical protein